jgi:hypothetical protein
MDAIVPCPWRAYCLLSALVGVWGRLRLSFWPHGKYDFFFC